jgi:hypothetical protein
MLNAPQPIQNSEMFPALAFLEPRLCSWREACLHWGGSTEAIEVVGEFVLDRSLFVPVATTFAGTTVAAKTVTAIEVLVRLVAAGMETDKTAVATAAVLPTRLGQVLLEMQIAVANSHSERQSLLS